MYELPHEYPNNLRLRILGNLEHLKKVTELVGFDAEYTACHPNAKF